MAAWLYRRKGSKKWWLGYIVNGQQFLKSSGETDKKSAERKIHKFELMEEAERDGRLTREFYEALTGTRVERVTLHSCIEDWLAECRDACAPGTVQRYSTITRDLKTHLKATETAPLIAEVSTEQIRAFLSGRLNQASASTVNLERKILSMFFIRCLKTTPPAVKVNPLLQIKPFKRNKAEAVSRRGFTIEELYLLYAKAPDEFWRYMVVAGFYSGQRMGDLICLRWSNFDFEQRMLNFTTRKTDRGMQIPIAAPLLRFILELKRKAGDVKPNQYLWPEQAARYQKHSAKVFSNDFYKLVLVPAGIAIERPKNNLASKNGRKAKRDMGPSFHSLRHSFVSFLRSTGGSQSVAKELAGHSSTAINDKYTHSSIVELQAAISKLPEVGA